MLTYRFTLMALLAFCSVSIFGQSQYLSVSLDSISGVCIDNPSYANSAMISEDQLILYAPSGSDNIGIHLDSLSILTSTTHLDICLRSNGVITHKIELKNNSLYDGSGAILYPAYPAIGETLTLGVSGGVVYFLLDDLIISREALSSDILSFEVNIVNASDVGARIRLDTLPDITQPVVSFSVDTMYVNESRLLQICVNMQGSSGLASQEIFVDVNSAGTLDHFTDLELPLTLRLQTDTVLSACFSVEVND